MTAFYLAFLVLPAAIVALVVVPAVAIHLEGGLGALVAELAALDPTLVDPAALGFGAVVGFLGIGLGGGAGRLREGPPPGGADPPRRGWCS